MRRMDAETVHRPHVVVQPVEVEADGRPFRRVDVLGQAVGHAYAAADVVEFMHRAGLNTALVDEPDTVEWRGGGPDDWEQHTPA
jgi:hypothetical protein